MAGGHLSRHYAVTDVNKLKLASSWQAHPGLVGNILVVPTFNFSTAGKRDFPVSGANFWNSLPLYQHRRSRYLASRRFSFTCHIRT